MHIVAVTELRGDLETEAPFIAEIVGLSPYDVRARLAGAMPRTLVHTADADLARQLQKKLEARGHAVLVVDGAFASATAHAVKLHRFNLDQGGVWANGLAGDRLAWGDLAVVVVAVVRGNVARTVEEVDYRVSSRGAESGTRQVKYDVTRTEHPSSHVAYLFPSTRATDPRPWLLDETAAQFMSLGARMQPTRRANFFTTLAVIRSFAPHAVVDDRFVASPIVAQSTLHVRGNETPIPVNPGASVDLTVTILASWLQRDRGGPYR